MNEPELFLEQVKKNIAGIGNDREFLDLTNEWIRLSIRHRYAHNFSWLGRPILQVPQDTYAIQEIIWQTRPDLIIETGIAHGGSLILSASMLAMLDYCDAVASGGLLDPRKSQRRVLGIDIDIRAHNRSAIEAHPMAHLIEMIQGSSIDPAVVERVKQKAREYRKVLVFLDSNHTHEHVLGELEAYAPLTSRGSYCVVWDTGIEDMPEGTGPVRPWGKGNNPKTAVWEYLRRLDAEGRQAADGTRLRLEMDKTIEHKLAITASPDGFLRRPE